MKRCLNYHLFKQWIDIMQPCAGKNSFCSYLLCIYPIQSNKITIQTKWYLERTNVKKWFCLVNRWHLYQGKIIYRLWNGLVLFFPFQSRCSPDAHFLRICILTKILFMVKWMYFCRCRYWFFEVLHETFCKPTFT